ncbi:DNA sulfur modification protein DndD [Kroppenstedtia eburnea]|uniref:DNA sulfur modification protein DndD n=1 Tax=Kroppenstedtia eburnea TaxID=714067 RepID=UPI0036411E83
MRFKKLTLENYRVFYGRQEFNFEVPKKQTGPYRKNLILIGGLNGSGKTTILTAIENALFARRGTKEDKYKEQYTNAINEKFHSQGGRDCSVSLEMEDGSETVTLEVTWTFDGERKLVNENRIVHISEPKTKEKRQLSMISDEFNEYINQRIPLNAAPFFMFDGEKIQSLIEQQTQKAMKDTIQKIVSLDTYKSLVSDLNFIQADLEKDLRKASTQEEQKTILDQIRNDQEKLDELRIHLKKTNDRIEELEARKNLVFEQQLQKKQRNYHSNTEIEKELTRNEERLKSVQKGIEDFGKNELIKLLIAPLTLQMQTTLREEENFLQLEMQEKAKFQSYHEFMNQFLEQVRSGVQPPLGEEQLSQLTELGEGVWGKLNRIKKKELPQRDIIHDLSPKDRRRLLSINPQTNQNIRSLLNQRLNLQTKRLELETQLENAPDPVDTSEEDQELEKINKNLGSLITKKKSYQKRIPQYETAVTQNRNILTRKMEESKVANKSQAEHEYVSKLKLAATEYVEKMTQLKVAKIKKLFMDILDKLIRKDQEFSRIEFNERDFIIRIFNEYDREINLNNRSAGEKQIIALSFIWALTKTAGVSLPFVIDTPLGRLDSIHRQHLIDYYFTQLSDQVIILSTDTEVSREYMDTINKYLVRSYRLEYDETEKSTQVQDGYFLFEQEVY